MTRALPLVALLCLLPALAHAGANETPGRDGQPHRFGYFGANAWEFGAGDKAIFDEYVVRLQHFTAGSRFVDSRLDASTGGAGVWNFVEFCANCRHDVLLLTAHGVDGPPQTLIAQFPYTAAGIAARDSLFDYWDEILEGLLIKEDYPDDGDCSLEIDQDFYTELFQTPRALAWWSTCYSSRLKLTGRGEARVHVGYDGEVQTSKCLCDERYILRRMNGHEGQDKRPVYVAALGVNGSCPPGGARTVLKGKLNTVLSPAVNDYMPRGIVCQVTPGYVEFDTSMDTKVPPEQVVRAEGDGILINHAWEGDYRVSYLVIPLGQQPTILYRARERQARSQADGARLDGNTVPQINAYGPNQDDFVWVTSCPAIPAPVVTPTYPIPARSTPSYPGARPRIITPIYNGTGSPQTVTAQLTDARGWLQTGPQVTPIDDGEVVTLAWDFAVPLNAVPGELDSLQLSVQGDGPPFVAHGALDVEQPLSGRIAGAAVVTPGAEPQALTLVLVNEGLDSLALRGATVTDALGWAITVAEPAQDFAPGEQREMEIVLQVPPTPSGLENPLTLHGEVDGLPVSLALGLCRSGAPLVFTEMEPLRVVPGNPDAQLVGGIKNRSLSLPLQLDYFVLDADGLEASATGPAVLAPGDSAGLTLHLDLPPDPSLIGRAGTLKLFVSDLDSGLAIEQPFAYQVEPAVAVSGQSGPPAPVYTGVAGGRSFPWPLWLKNESALAIEGTVSLLGGPPITPSSMPFSLAPGDSLIADFAVTIEEAHPAGVVLPVQLLVITMNGLGNRVEECALFVQPPVVAGMRRPVFSTTAGSEGELAAVIENLRPDRAQSVDWEWWDARGWLLPPQIGALELPAAASETLRVSYAVPAPAGGRAAADSDSVALRLHLISDGGLPIETGGSLWLMVLDDATAAPDQPLPARDALLANWPNPFNPSTLLRFHLSAPGRICLEAMDVTGRRVALLAEGEFAAGVHELRWQARDAGGRSLPSGVYFLRLTTGRGETTQKAVLLR